MTAQYVPLNDLHGDSDQYPSTAANSLLGKSRRLPKRWLSFSLVIVVLLTFFLLSGPQITSSKLSQPTGHSSSISYLLGDEQHEAKLWFPPRSSGSPFEPVVATYNNPPSSASRPRTPLLIAFTRNNAMLQQTVLSYIAAGWPREDIIVVDNSGTMDANNLGLLSHDNPFFLDYNTLRSRYGVSILQTPTLLNFPQIMNFYLRLSIAHHWQYFFWSHMDVAVLSDEAAEPYQSFYQRILGILRDLGIRDPTSLDGARKIESDGWAIKYFSYDWLTLVNVGAWRKIGQWDNFIPYYSSDCDAYSRIVLNGFSKDDVRAGRIFDLPTAMTDPETKFFPQQPSPSKDGETANGINSPHYQNLLAELTEMQDSKPENNRNNWQGMNTGGQGEPWTYNPNGFQEMWWATADLGRALYKKKWGTSECRLDEHGVKLTDEWRKDE